MTEIQPETGYIKLFRKFTKWEWYNDANTMRVFLHCLLHANHVDKNWRGILVKRGSVLTGRRKLAVSLNLTEMQIRTALKRLKSTNEITIETTSEYSIITLNNWDLYQQNNQPFNQQITNKQPTDNQRITTTKNDKNEKNDKNNNSCVFFEKKSPTHKKTIKKFIKPTIEEITQYCRENDKHIDVHQFWDFYESKNWMIGKNKMQKWKSAVSLWDRRNKPSGPSEPHVPVYSNEIED